jgi:hypothetical protein
MRFAANLSEHLEGKLPRPPMPLPESDYRAMNTSDDEFFQLVLPLPELTQFYVTNATHRLAEVDWLTRTLEEQVRTSRAPVCQEGLLSLQLYLLLTCADTLGHHYSCTGGVWERFKAFFHELPQEAKQNLTDHILAWKTDFAELVDLGLGNAETGTVVYPSSQRILQAVQPLTSEKRLEAVVAFLYLRRNSYTHEANYPQLGFHPNLSVMQSERMCVPNTAKVEEFGRLQVILDKESMSFAFYETNDVIAVVRWSVVRGLGKIIGRI